MTIPHSRIHAQLLSSTNSKKVLTLTGLAHALHGDLNGNWVNIPGPGHSSEDRSLGIRFDRTAPDGFHVNTLASDDPDECRAYVKALLERITTGVTLKLDRTEAADPAAVRKRKTDAALRIWHQGLPAKGTLVEIYLQSRGITLPLPWSLRFHPALRHSPGQTWPAMIALVTDAVTGDGIAILRTFLARDGKGKAPITPEKKMLGPCRGGVVGLAPVADSLLIGEGIETCMSVMQATERPTWAALSAPNLRSLNLPNAVREVTLLADGDDPGEAAARAAGNRWRLEGRRVRIARPPRGLDFNDVLTGRSS
jgi:putative DNA primase/helicase